MIYLFTWLPASNNYIWFQKTSLYGFKRLHKKLWVWDAKIARFRGYYFQFGSVFIKKKKTKPNRNWFKPTGFGSVRFFGTKIGSNQFDSVFSGLAPFFWFNSVFSVWVRFVFSGFRLIKPKPNRTGQFFQNFNHFNRFFFHGSVFSVIFNRLDDKHSFYLF